ncbi:MAG: glycosyltransferase [Spirochaetota bacterium]
MPYVSVIIPTWNRALTIGNAVRSVLCQTFTDLEVLVCDDGSTDTTMDIVRGINDVRVRFIQGPRGGRPAIPRNRGIALARGEWIAFLDSDDEWMPDKLEKQLSALKGCNEKACSTNAIRILPDKSEAGNLLDWQRSPITFDVLNERINPIICSSIIVHRSLFDIIEGFPEEEYCTAEDYSLWMRLSTQTNVIFLSEPLVRYSDDAAHSVRTTRPAVSVQKQWRELVRTFLPWALKQSGSEAFIERIQKLRILHTLENYHSSMGGMYEVVKRLSEGLVDLGHRVTVATNTHPDRHERKINGVNIVEFNVRGNAAQGMEGDIASYQDFLQHSNFDVVTNFAAQQWATDAMLPILRKITAKKVFVPTGFSGLHWPEYRDYFEKMKSWMKEYDATVFLSDDYRDVNFARENGIEKRVLIPNGASEEEFTAKPNIDIRKKLKIGKDTFLILHVGSHTGVKGHKECYEMFDAADIHNGVLLMVGNFIGEGPAGTISLKRRIKNMIKAVLSIFGLYPRPVRQHVGCAELCSSAEKRYRTKWKRERCGKRLIVRSLTREETVAAYLAADLFLFPSNIECSPIVLFECMASRTPFIAADVGNADEIASWSNAGIVLPTEKDDNGFSHVDVSAAARALVSLYKDDDMRRRMQDAGYAAWKARFTWESITKEYERLYCGLVDERGVSDRR